MATILVVDDRPTDRELLVTLLEHQQHRVLEAADGAQALRLVQAEHPDLVVSDVLLPQIDGYQLVRQLRADPVISATPVIFYTASFNEREARELARELGVALVLAKPTDPEKLLESVVEVLKAEGIDKSPSLPAGFDQKHQQLLIDKLLQQVDELYHSEEREQARAAELQAILDAVPAYIFLAHDPDCLNITGNSMTYELLGGTPGSNLSRVAPQGKQPKNFRIMQHGRELSPQALPVYQAARGQIVRDAEVDLVFDDGSVRCLLGNAVPLLEKDGRPRGAVAAFVDITTRRRLEEALQRAQGELEQRVEERTSELKTAVELLEEEVKSRQQMEEEIRMLNEELEMRVQERTAQLESANRELEAFSYSVSHDLKAPIRAIDGFSRILLTGYGALLDAEGRRLLKVISTNTRIMGQLIDDLLGLSHLGRKRMRKIVFNLAALSRQVFNNLKAMAPGRSLQLIIKDLPPAYGDLSLINQVMVNFLANAIKFTKSRKTAIIEVGGRTEGLETIFYVKDNGIGFDERYAHHLFGAFQRLHGSEEYEGTGIGLAIVHRVIQRHGGRVWAEGKLDQGATFYFALPKHTGESLSDSGEPAKELPPE